MNKFLDVTESIIKYNIDTIVKVLIGIQFISILYSSVDSVTNTTTLVISVLAGLIFIAHRNKVSKMQKHILSFILLLMLISTLVGSGGFGSILNMTTLLILIESFFKIEMSEESKRKIVYFYVISLLLFRLFSRFEYTYYINESLFKYFVNPNTFGYLSVNAGFLIYYLVRKSKIELKFISVLVVVFFISESSSRTMLAAYMVFLLGIIIFNIINYDINIKVISKVFFVAVLFTFIYAIILPNVISADAIIFGKGFFSGRQTIWKEVYELLESNWLFGVGADYGFVNGKFFSAHNMWLGIAVIFGIPTLLLVILYLYKLFDRILSSVSIENRITVFSFLVANIIISNFETVHTFNLVISFAPLFFLIYND